MRQPLFILCPGRSFSSVVCAAIGQHPQMFGLPEVNLFFTDDMAALMSLDVPFLGLPGALTGLRRVLAELLFGEQTVETVNLADAWLRERRDWTGARMFEALREMAAPRLLVDKTPTNSQSKALARVLAAYPDAYFLHLARHPRSTSRSRMKAYEKHRRGKTPNAERLWLDRHAELMAFGETLRPGQYMFLRGEWFFEEPAEVMAQVCDWLNLSADEASVAAMLRPEDSPFARPGPENARLGNNPGFIEDPKLRIGKVKPENLTDPLDWIRDSETHFGAKTRDLAAILGYSD